MEKKHAQDSKPFTSKKSSGQEQFLSENRSPAIRHAPILEEATAQTRLHLKAPPEQSPLIDALDLALWLKTSPALKTARASLFWAAIRWLCTEPISGQNPDRLEQARIILDSIKNELPTKQVSKNTIIRYEACLKAMIAWSQRKRITDEESTAFVDELVAAEDMLARQDLSPAAMASYRSALLWHLDQKKDQSPRDQETRRILSEYLASRGHTRRKQLQVVPEKDLALLIDHLKAAAQKEQNGLAAMTITWILAGLATGLRPIEWRDAAWASPEMTALAVVSAKTKVGLIGYLDNTEIDALERLAMTPIETRKVPILDPEDAQAVNDMLALVRSRVPETLGPSDREASFHRLYLAVKQRLGTSNAAVFKGKKNVTLYAFRRQFSANAKATLGAAATAEVMGHSSPDSPSAGYYGKRNQAHSRFKGQISRAQQVRDQDAGIGAETSNAPKTEKR
jgi:hypothetical protein